MLDWSPEAEPTSSDVRWALHTGVGWRHSPLRKVRSCRRAPIGMGRGPDGRQLVDTDIDEVGVTFRAREDGGVDVGINGTKTCGSWHSCVQCGTRIAVHRAAELEHVFRIWEHLGNSVVLGTFTLRHGQHHALRELVAGQRAGWSAVTSDRPWKADLEEMGVALFPVESDSGRVRNVKGVIRAFECTDGDEHGWHPHYHVFFLVKGQISQGRAEAAVTSMWSRWVDGLAQHGFTAVAEVNGESAGLDVTVLGRGGGLSETYGRYPFKLALEAVGGVFKHGRGQDRKGREVGHRHRTPTEIMEHIAVAQVEGRLGDDQAQRDLARWEEWCRTANDMRFRQCPIPMRAWFAAKAAELGIPGPLLDEDLDDEEIAAAEVEGTEQGGHMPASEWQRTAAYEYDSLRATGREDGLRGVVVWFDQRRIPFELSRSGEARLIYECEHPPPGRQRPPAAA